MLVNFVKSDRFLLVIFAMALAAGGLWYLRPQLGSLPLLVALAPWVVRAAVGLLPFRPSLLDAPIVLFLATAAGGLWISYDQEAAQAKYWLIIGAVLIFYSLIIQPRPNVWLLAGFITLFGVGIASYFLLTHDWQTQPAKIQFLNQIGLRLMAIRPTLGIDAIHPNVAGGLAAIAIPFPIAIGLRELRSGRRWRNKIAILFLASVSVAYLAFVLLITTSRGAWLALGAALMLWMMWEGSSMMAVRHRIDTRLIFGVTFLSLSVIGLFIILTFPGGPITLINQLPGPSNIDSRTGLIKDTLHLIGDFPLIGAGLASFPGLYANYILILPTFVLGHSHNLLLDITLEQGFLGLLAFTGVWALGFWLLVRPKASERRIRHLSLLRWAVISSMTVFLLHGLIDDPLYGSRAVLFLFLIPGMAVAVARSRSRTNGEGNHKKRSEPLRFNVRASIAATGLILLLFAFVAVVSRNTILSAWYANWGAIEMARIELADWPTDQWNDGRNVALFASVEPLFTKALANNPMNTTAHYRLGLIALLRRNFAEAAQHLEDAYQTSPDNKGIQKTLGYSYAWLGDFDNAFAYLRTIRESRQEMNIYINWWSGQGRPDLSSNAAVMEQRLQPVELIPVN